MGPRPNWWLLAVALVVGVAWLLALRAHFSTARPYMEVVLRAQSEGELSFEFARPLLRRGTAEPGDRNYVVARLNRLLDRAGLHPLSAQVVRRDKLVIRTTLPKAPERSVQVALQNQLSHVLCTLRVDQLPDDKPHQPRPFTTVRAPGTIVLHRADQKTLAGITTVIEKRARALALHNLSVRPQPPDRIVIELPGANRVAEARAAIKQLALVGRSAAFELRQLSDRYAVDPGSLSRKWPGFLDRKGNPVSTSQVIADSPLILTSQQLKDDCRVGQQTNTGQPVVRFSWTPAGGKIFEEFTRSSIGRYVLIVLGRKVVSAPKIMAVIGAEGIIAGNFSPKEARDLAAILNSGRLPLLLEEVSVKRVGIM